VARPSPSAVAAPLLLATAYAAGAVLLVLRALPAPGAGRTLALALAVPAAGLAGALAGLAWSVTRRLHAALDELERRLHEWAGPIAARAVERVAGTGPWAGAEELRLRIERWIAGAAGSAAPRGGPGTALGRLGLRLAARRALRRLDAELAARGQGHISAAALEQILRERLVALLVDRARDQVRLAALVVGAVSALAVLGPVAAWLLAR
jgi:hypothetical protein